jgi:predicted alpha/beta hydrolase family esterase
MKRRAYIFVNGIRTSATDIECWHFEAERWVELNMPGAIADTYHYECGALTRWLGQPDRVKTCAALLRKFVRPDIELIAVGHSNGCAVLVDALRQNRDIPLAELHLVAAACDADFKRNGLNYARLTGQVRQVNVYWSRSDKVLQWARASWRLLHWMGLGYGYLGLVGPQHAMPASESCPLNSFEMWGFDHSTYWWPQYFERTMRAITGVTP